jgi:hypothetical protein
MKVVPAWIIRRKRMATVHSWEISSPTYRLSQFKGMGSFNFLCAFAIKSFAHSSWNRAMAGAKSTALTETVPDGVLYENLVLAVLSIAQRRVF